MPVMIHIPSQQSVKKKLLGALGFCQYFWGVIVNFGIDIWPSQNSLYSLSHSTMIFARSTEAGHEIVNWGPTINGVALGLVIGAGLLVIWRLIIRFRLDQLGWDDLCIVLGLVSNSIKREE